MYYSISLKKEADEVYYLLAALASVLISVMVAINGQLSAFYGLHISILLIHTVGLVFISLIALARREKLFSIRGLPFAIFSGGVIGYFTTLFNNMSTGKISITAILALSLLGQSVISLFIDQFGFFGMPVRKFSLSKLAGLAMATVGIVFLLYGSMASAFVPVFVSLLTGVTVVTSRCVNAQLAERTSVLAGTWYNYVTGMAVSAMALGFAALFGNAGAPDAGAPIHVWVYLGGAIGAAVVLLSNICVRRMSSFAMTLVMFAGQVFGGVSIDAVVLGDFSWRTLVGGGFAFLGLVLNVLLDAKEEKRKAESNKKTI
jgi:transporter family-2 protein